MEFESNAYECLDWVEEVIEDLIGNIKEKRIWDRYDVYRKEGAIDALDYLLNIIKGN